MRQIEAEIFGRCVRITRLGHLEGICYTCYVIWLAIGEV